MTSKHPARKAALWQCWRTVEAGDDAREGERSAVTVMTRKQHAHKTKPWQVPAGVGPMFHVVICVLCGCCWQQLWSFWVGSHRPGLGRIGCAHWPELPVDPHSGQMAAAWRRCEGRALADVGRWRPLKLGHYVLEDGRYEIRREHETSVESRMQPSTLVFSCGVSRICNWSASC